MFIVKTINMMCAKLVGRTSQRILNFFGLFFEQDSSLQLLDEEKFRNMETYCNLQKHRLCISTTCSGLPMH